MGGYRPTFRADSLKLYIGTPAVGRAVAADHTLSDVLFTWLDGQPARTTFTSEDVGMPIAIIGGGPVDPFMPSANFVQGAMFHTTIASVTGPDEVELVEAPDTGIYNTGFVTVVCYRPAQFRLDGSFNFYSSIAPGTRDTLNFSVLGGTDYIDRFTTIAMGQPVYLVSDDPAVGDIFGGEIDTVKALNEPGLYSDVFQWQCKCADWASIAIRRVVNPAYPQTFTGDAGETFTKIALNYCIDEGVSTNVSTGPTITIQCPAGARVNQLLDQVVQQCATPLASYYWYVDVWRCFHFHERVETAAPWNVDDTLGSASNVLAQVSCERLHDQLATAVFAIGQFVLGIPLQPPPFYGDGVARNFSVLQPIYAQPALQVNGTPVTVGVLGVDVGKDWYWNQGSPVLTQSSAGTVLGPTDYLEVAYQTATASYAQTFNSASLAQRSAYEATSGQWDYTILVQEPISASSLLSLASTYADQYGTPSRAILASTIRPGLKVGQLQHIRLADIEVEGDFLVETVRMYLRDTLIQWDYTAFDGLSVGQAITGLVQFINRSKPPFALTDPSQLVGSAGTAYHEIVIDHTKVVGALKTNYVFFFGGTYDWLQQTPDGYVANADGSDIYFTDESGTLLDYDLSFYDPATGRIAAWIRIPALSILADTIVRIEYGNPSQPSQANPPGVWSPAADVSGAPNPNFREVFHLGETTGPYLDSTKYTNDSTGSLGTGYPVRVDGPFGYAANVPLTSYFGIQVPACLEGDAFNNYSGSLACWVKATGLGSGYYDDIFDAQISTVFGHGLAIAGRGNPSAMVYPYGVININGGVNEFSDLSTDFYDGAWHWVVVTMDGSGSHLYFDGVKIADGPYGQNYAMNSDHPIQIFGNRGGLSFTTFTGSIAEAWVNQEMLDADLIATLWANMGDPGTFYSLAAGSVPPGPTTPGSGNPAGTVTHTTGPLTLNYPVLGNGDADVKAGDPGQLVPPGGGTGEVLTKGSASDYDTEWAAAGAGGNVTTSATLTATLPVLGNGGVDVVVGVAGQLVPPGGGAGEVLTKTSGTNYDTEWAAGGGSTHSEPLTDGDSNFIFGAGDIIVAYGIPN